MRISADNRLLSVTAVLAAILIGVAGAGMRAAASVNPATTVCTYLAGYNLWNFTDLSNKLSHD